VLADMQVGMSLEADAFLWWLQEVESAVQALEALGGWEAFLIRCDYNLISLPVIVVN